MALIAEVQDGPQKTLRFHLMEGNTFGRKKADYVLTDENISSLHCRVEKDAQGRLLLIDLDSSNGIIINSRKVKKINLIQGVSFRLGSTTLKVSEITDEVANALATGKKWRGFLEDFLSDTPAQNAPTALPPVLFNPTLELEVVQGLQVEDKYVLSYGPRRAGFGHLDLDIQDQEAPDLAFEIIPVSPIGAQLVNRSGFKVLLNKSPVDKATLKEGDLIQVGRTLLKVSFV